LQLFPPIDAPTVKIIVVPPDANPVASDIVSANLVPLVSGRGDIVYEPLPLLNADAGTE
jgi:hypothetical protein